MKSPNPSPSAPVAYSYIRFSTPEQATGDSLRRQREAAENWCEKNGVRLDASLTLRDLGKSAYLGEHRRNPDRFALAAFLKLVQDDRVPRGSYLVIESLDRLTREHVRAGLMLLLGLIESGIRIVQLSPSELVYDEKADEMAIMLAVVELARGHRESKRKSDLVGAAWIQKRKRAREAGEVLTHRLPAWVEKKGDKLALIPERVAAVRRVFELAAGGYGCTLIVRKLTEEKIPAFVVSRRGSPRNPESRGAYAGRWVRSYIGMLLHDRRVLGEFQPRLRDGTAEGPPISDYYPRAVSEELWLAARGGALQRRDRPGAGGQLVKEKPGEKDSPKRLKHVNLFAGLLHDARGGGSYITVTRTNTTRAGKRDKRLRGKGKQHQVLIVASSLEGKTPCWSFPLADFEAAVLSQLREIDPREIIEPDASASEVLALSGELTAVEERIAELEVELLKGDVAALAKVLRQLEAQKRELAGKLAEARQRAASPVSEAWGECQSLLAALGKAPDPEDARLRLRSVLRRVVDSIWLLVVPRSRDRLAAVQVWFADGKRCRDYLILHRPPRANSVMREDGKRGKLSRPFRAKPGALDLRKRADAKKLEAALQAVDLEALWQLVVN